MTTTKIDLTGKKILIVDDEKDVLESLIELLDMCKLDTAASFEEGKKLLENHTYDIAILDIMGVNGFKLLDIATQRNTPALMLTANALSEQNLQKSAKNGAAYFVPKDNMSEIDTYVADVLTALASNKSTWEVWFDRLSSFYDKRFKGTDWREKEKEFWQKKMKTRF